MCFVFSSLSFAVTPEPPSIPPNYVVDLAGVIRDDTEAQLNSYLRELEQKTTAQVVILTIQSLDGEDIEGFSMRIAEKWKLGQKGKDNGLLITIALKDRKYRFETGYGLEGILPDSLVGSIGRQYFVPYFKKGDYSTGIVRAVEAVVSVIAENHGVEISGMPKIDVRQQTPINKGRSIFNIAVSIFIFILVVYLFIRHPRLLLLFFLSSSMGGRRSGWSGGGGFGGGGFGGGGGGGFGGGGASGEW
ncbi:methanol dehydrogenase [Dissulfurispira thermophila]|uniref:Methanol dehydrogenase n=1 Tax=Dissulfurispira thermophila TaxID=2715679 RepID=A0A7G1H3L8_9BACT|nr:TPM domain-containing protein [Dissulfurispira thermophila]BCB96732.1 methanol dehydrogenase [Dissulfurispira thermophila]